MSVVVSSMVPNGVVAVVWVEICSQGAKSVG